jgi:predicted nucleic acid-binding protein
MRLVVDASVLIAELLRATGRERLGNDRLELFLPEPVWAELQHELPRRVAAFARRRGIAHSDVGDLARLCLAAVEANVVVLDEALLSPFEEEARARVPRDPNDWPLVAAALALGAGIWTLDKDLLGAGVATWTTETLQAWLQRNPGG